MAKENNNYKRIYAEKLKDPRWREKREKILMRDEYKCCLCGSEELPLHVHHLKYYGEPWQVMDWDLQTLCASCHEEETFNRKYEEDDLLMELRRRGLPSHGVMWLRLALQRIDKPLNDIDTMRLFLEMVQKEWPRFYKSHIRKMKDPDAIIHPHDYDYLYGEETY